MAIYNLEDYATTEQIPIAYKLTSTSDVSKHTHTCVEIFYVISGTIEHKFSDSPSSFLQAGDGYLIMPTVSHEFLRNSSTECTHRDILIRDSFFREVCNFIDPNLYDNFANGKMPVKIHLSANKINYLEHQIKLINQTLPTNLGQKTSIIRAFGVSILEPFLSSGTESHFGNFPAWFKELLANFNKIQYVQAGLKAIIKPLNYDRKYMCRVFKKYMGITMTEYLNHVRLDYAINMIENTNKNILDIAQELGFASVSYFNVIFKKRFGITPMEARQKKVVKND